MKKTIVSVFICLLAITGLGAGLPYVPNIGGKSTNLTIYSPNTNRAALEVWPTVLENVAGNTNSGKPITIGTNINTGSGDWINIPAVVTDMNRANEARSGIMWDPPAAAGNERARIQWLPFHAQNGPAPNGYANNGELTIVSPGGIHIYNGASGVGGLCLLGGTGQEGTSTTLQYSAGGDVAGGAYAGKGHSAHLGFVTRHYNGGIVGDSAEFVFEAMDTAGDTRLNFYLPADGQFVSDGTWRGIGTLIFGVKTNGLLVGSAFISTNGVFTGYGYQSYTNTVAANAALVMGREYDIVTSGTVTLGISTFSSVPSSNYSYTAITITSSGTATFTNHPSIHMSDGLTSRVLSNSCEIAVKIIPRFRTNGALVQFP